MQEERYLGRIEPGMDLCDVNGDKLGTVAQVIRHEYVTAPTDEMPTEDYLEV